MNEAGTINIHGNEYTTVAARVQQFRKKHPELGLLTEIIYRDDSIVVMKASILAEDGRVIATGHAEESRASSQINKTSALENCETSAIGRALAAFGMAGTEFASADELTSALKQRERSQRAAYRQAPNKPAVGVVDEPKPATASQKARITAYLRGQGIQDADIPKVLHTDYGVDNAHAMTADEAENAIKVLATFTQESA